MKSVKNHLMFIIPLMAILLGIEFYTVFGRVTAGYESRLQEGYSMLVVTKKPVTLADLQKANSHIATLKPIERERIVADVSRDMSQDNRRAILQKLPYFYDVGLDRFVGTKALEAIRSDLEKLDAVKRVETFGASYASAYKLFVFIKLLLKLFIGFLTVISLLLIVKQVEIWKYEHRERMQVMEIFGAPLMLRAGVLFRIAVIDAVFATLLTAAVFGYAKTVWAPSSGIDLLIKHQAGLFAWNDLGLLLVLSLGIVIVSVYSVVIANTKGVEE